MIIKVLTIMMLPFRVFDLGVEPFFNRIMSNQVISIPSLNTCHFYEKLLYNINEQVFDKNMAWRYTYQRLGMGN